MIELNFEDCIQITKQVWKLKDKKIDVSVKSLLNASEMVALYEQIMSSLKDDNDDNYHPEKFEYVWRYTVIESYSSIKMPDDTDLAYLVCFSELWDLILDAVSIDQLNTIYDSVTETIKRDENCKCASIHWKELLNDIQTITNAMLNFDKLPEWLADKLDESDSPLAQKV